MTTGLLAVFEEPSEHLRNLSSVSTCSRSTSPMSSIKLTRGAEQISQKTQNVNLKLPPDCVTIINDAISNEK